ncbi:MAG: sugar phosphate nucleotidyltransferase [Candidatus Methylomirabilales bacterium]
MRAHEDVWVVVLAGGQGVRLEPFIRNVLHSDRPKQFCRIIGRRSMLRHTWDRALQLAPAPRTVTVITAGQERFLADEAPLGIPGRILVQPRNRETGPGLILPLLWIARRDPHARVAVFPADHFIWEEFRFLQVVQAALAAARAHPRQVVLLGMEATTPDTGYGWIAPGRALEGCGASEDLYQVQAFWEKPDRDLAMRLQAAGCLWNSFVLAASVDALLALAEAHLPDAMATLREASAWWETPREAEALAVAYRELTPANFSRQVLEPGCEALLVRAVRGVTWCDWGDADRILRTVRQFDRRPSWLPALGVR